MRHGAEVSLRPWELFKLSHWMEGELGLVHRLTSFFLKKIKTHHPSAISKSSLSNCPVVGSFIVSSGYDTVAKRDSGFQPCLIPY